MNRSTNGYHRCSLIVEQGKEYTDSGGIVMMKEYRKLIDAAYFDPDFSMRVLRKMSSIQNGEGTVTSKSKSTRKTSGRRCAGDWFKRQRQHSDPK